MNPASYRSNRKALLQLLRRGYVQRKIKSIGRKQAILAGMETQVCVLQTVDDLMQKGYTVHPVADAICSRRKLDWEIGLRWKEKKGGDDLDHRDHRLSTVEGGWDGGVQEALKIAKMIQPFNS